MNQPRRLRRLALRMGFADHIYRLGQVREPSDTSPGEVI